MSYAAKWVETSAEYQKTSVICPANVEPELARQISAVALRAFRAVGGRGYGRVSEPCSTDQVFELNFLLIERDLRINRRLLSDRELILSSEDIELRY